MTEHGDFEVQVKLAIYRHFAETGESPTPSEVARRAGSDEDAVLAAYRRLREQRVLLPADDGVSIRMAPPFSGVATQHGVESAGIRYFANCAWDAFGIPAALQREARVRSRCEQSREALELEVGREGPKDPAAVANWRFHCLVPAAHWWDDLPHT